MLKNKKILLAICGSISFYKTYELLSELKKLEADVYVMLSDGALKFVNKESFEALCDHRVLCSSSEDFFHKLNHIEYSKVDLVVLAPATVNTINKLANGICDSVFMETLITASNVPFVIAPAANERMLNHFSTINSLNLLAQNGACIVDPIQKKLACGDIGKGALARVDDILMAIKKEFLKDKFYIGKTVVITGGSTMEKIDDVRAITNMSSGKTSKALADAFYLLGADVVFISSIDFEVPYKFIKFTSSFGLKTAIENQKMNKNDILIMSAAVSDFIPNKIKGKISKDEIKDILTLKFRKNEDIISNIKNKDIKKIGFKLEVSKDEAYIKGQNMLIKKNLDAVCLNVLDDFVKFGSDNTKITFITKNGNIEIPQDTKVSVAFKIAELIKSL